MISGRKFMRRIRKRKTKVRMKRSILLPGRDPSICPKLRNQRRKSTKSRK